MTYSFLIILMLFSFQAFSCPDISGNYKSCKSDNFLFSTSELHINQSLENGIFIFTFNELDEDTGAFNKSVLIADGKKHIVKEPQGPGQPAEYTITAITCSGPQVIVNAQLLTNNNLVADIVMKYTKSGNVLNQVISGEIYGDSFDTTAICK